MGVLDIICLTTDPDSTTFYGFAYAGIYDCNHDCSNNVLVKSQANPVSGKNITWSLVSRIDSRNMTGIAAYVDSADFSCSVNAQGVFTMFGWTRYSRNGPGRTYGLRYDPAGIMDAKYNFQGSGSWMDMAIDRAYDWTETGAQHKLGYVNNGVTTELVHSVLSIDSSKIYLAKVDEATKTLTAAGNWALNATEHGNVKGMGIGNNHLYAFGDPLRAFLSPYLTGFPLATISPTTPVGKLYNARQVFGEFPVGGSQKTYLYVYQNTLTLILAQPRGGPRSTIYKINDPTTPTSQDFPPPTLPVISPTWITLFLLEMGLVRQRSRWR